MTHKIKPTSLFMLILLGVMIVAFVFARLRFMDIPLDRDEGSYLYMGYCFINGYIPYVDFYEIKPPGIFLVYGLFQIIFGSSTFLLHLGILLTQLTTAYLIYLIMFKMFGNKEQSIVAVSVYFIFNLFPNFMGFGILSEHFFVLFILLSMFFLLKVRQTNVFYYIFISGIFFGIAAMIRQHAVFFAIPMLALILFVAINHPFRWYRILGVFIAGSVTITLLLIGYVAIRGGFSEMIYWVFKQPSEKYITKVSWATGQQYLLNYIHNIFIGRHYPMLVIFGFGILFIFKNIFSNHHRKENALLLLFFIGALMTVFPGNRFYGHYWLMVFPFFSLIAGKFMEQLPIKWYQYVSLLSIVVLFINQLILNKALYFNVKADIIYQNLYADNPNYSLQKMTDFLKRRLKKEDQIFVFGSEPQVYYETKKILPLPHVFLSFLHLPSNRAINDQNETISYLEKTKPAYIVHLQNPISVGMKENSDQSLYQWIFNFESMYYEKIALADINDQNIATYYFGQEANITPKSSNYIYVYQRKK